MEAYKLPGNVSKKLKEANPDAKTRITRVFRDAEELPLSSDLEGSIIDALRSAEWLIVICSPRLKESLWCKKEIETFISFHGPDHVLAVLVEGEPAESFPEELLYKEVTVTNPDGSTQKVKKPVEPMAADVRGNGHSEIKKKINTDLLRLCAPIFGLPYDDLKQRHREAKLKRTGIIASVIAAAAVLFAIASFAVAMKIKSQSEQIAAQYEQLCLNQAETLAGESLEMLGKDDRESAIDLAYSSLTEHDGIDMPYTDLGRYALTQSLKPYEVSDDYCQKYRIKTAGKIQSITVSPDKSLMAVSDRNNGISVVSVADRKVIQRIDTGNDCVYSYQYAFVNEDELVYTDGLLLEAYKISTGESSEAFVSNEEIVSVEHDPFNHKVLMFFQSSVVIVDDVNYKFFDNILDVSAEKAVFLDGGYTALFTTDECIILDSDYKEVMRADTYNYLYNYEDDAILDGDTLYIMTSGVPDAEDTDDSDEEYYDESDYVTLRAYSLSTKEMKWENAFSGDLQQIELSVGDGPERLVAFGYDYTVTFDKEDGTAVDLTDLEEHETLLWAGVIDDCLSFVTSEGYLGTYSNDSFYYVAPYIRSELDSVNMAEVIGNDIYMTEIGGSDLICYGRTKNTQAASFTGDSPQFPDCVVLDQYSDELALLELPDENLVESVVIDDEEEYMFVTYSDERMVLYRVSDNEEMCSVDFDDEIIYYLGKDKEGNAYWQGMRYSYVLSPDCNVIAKMLYLEALDADNNELIFGYMDEYYKLPIYSLDELLKMAEEY